MSVRSQAVGIIIDSWFPEQSRPGKVGGAQVHVRELTAVLTKRYPVHFTFFFPAYGNAMYQWLWVFIAFFRILQHHRKQPFSLLHGHGIAAGLVTHYAGKWLHVPTLITVHGTHSLDMKVKSIKTWLERKVFTKLKYTAQISVAKTFLKYPNVNTDIAVIPNAVTTNEFDEVMVEKPAEPTLIWVGNNSPVKGLKYLRQAILKVRKKYPTLKAKLVSDGQLTGKALIKAYKRAHVFVLPSLAEGQPITLLEAWAAKLPVIVTDVGDNADIVKDGINGYVVEPGNVTQLANALLKVLRARTKNEKMGELGYQLVKQDYSWEKAAEKTWKVYQQIGLTYNE